MWAHVGPSQPRPEALTSIDVSARYQPESACVHPPLQRKHRRIPKADALSLVEALSSMVSGGLLRQAQGPAE